MMANSWLKFEGFLKRNLMLRYSYPKVQIYCGSITKLTFSSWIYRRKQCCTGIEWRGALPWRGTVVYQDASNYGGKEESRLNIDLTKNEIFASGYKRKRVKVSTTYLFRDGYWRVKHETRILLFQCCKRIEKSLCSLMANKTAQITQNFIITQWIL